MSTMIPRRSERNRRPTKWAIEETATERSRHDRQDSRMYLLNFFLLSCAFD